MQRSAHGRVALAAALLAAGLAAGCSPAAAKVPDPASLLPRTGDLPNGFIIGPVAADSDPSGSDFPICGIDAANRPDRTGRRALTAADFDTRRFVEFEAATYAGTGAEAAVTSLREAARTCTRATALDKGKPVRFLTIGLDPSPGLPGDQAVIQEQIGPEKTQGFVTIVLAAKGHVLIGAGVGDADLVRGRALAEQLVKQGLSRAG